MRSTVPNHLEESALDPRERRGFVEVIDAGLTPLAVEALRAWHATQPLLNGPLELG